MPISIKRKTYILIPLYNEESQIVETLNEVKREGYINYILINDGSTDGTAEKIKQYSEKNPHLNIIIKELVQNKGVGAATQEGFNIAQKKRIEYLVTFDGDGQHVASDIEKVIEPFKRHEEAKALAKDKRTHTELNDKKVNVVIGSRFKKNIKAEKSIPFKRVVFNKIGNMMTFLLFGLYVSDSQSGLKAFSKEGLASINLKTNGYEFCSEVIAEIKKKKLKFEEIGISVLYTDYSLKKGQNLLKGIETLYKLFKYRLGLI